jgi:hypothetical protein
MNETPTTLVSISMTLPIIIITEGLRILVSLVLMVKSNQIIVQLRIIASGVLKSVKPLAAP